MLSARRVETQRGGGLKLDPLWDHGAVPLSL